MLTVMPKARTVTSIDQTVLSKYRPKIQSQLICKKETSDSYAVSGKVIPMYWMDMQYQHIGFSKR